MIAKLKRLAANAKARLAARAVLAGVAVLVSTVLQAHGHVDRSLLEGALTSAGWVALEAFTPLNGLVGWLKQAGIEPPKKT